MQKNKGEKRRKLKGSDLFIAEIVSLGASQGLLECSIPTPCSQGKESDQWFPSKAFSISIRMDSTPILTSCSL